MRRAFSLLSGNSSTSVCMSATWMVRLSSTDRPGTVPRTSGRTDGQELAVMAAEEEPIAVPA